MQYLIIECTFLTIVKSLQIYTNVKHISNMDGQEWFNHRCSEPSSGSLPDHSTASFQPSVGTDVTGFAKQWSPMGEGCGEGQPSRQGPLNSPGDPRRDELPAVTPTLS